MRTTLAVGVILTALALGASHPQAQTFRQFRCSCQSSSPALTITPTIFGQVPVTSWQGTVYALSDSSAQSKAKNACMAEVRGSPRVCDSCFCLK